MNLERAWHTLWSRNSQGDPEDEYEALRTAYGEPHRAYHNLAHVEDCLRQLEQCIERGDVVPQNIDAIQLALWLHDVVYEIGAPDNEEQSADWAAAALTRGNAAADLIDRVHALILATKHPSTPYGHDAKLIVDIDLSILGRPPAEFAQYETRIRTEYQQVPAPRYRSGRAKILQGFLDRPSIYYTNAFQKKYEVQARENLGRSIRQLQIR